MRKSLKVVAFGGQSFSGLLDSYSGAAASYSLRRLTKAYTGNLIRVRRSSDNTEQDFGYDSNNVLDTTALLTFCGAGNGFVTTWYDQSGNARNATQTTAANQPKIVNSGSVLVDSNGKPRVQGYQSISTNLKATLSANQPLTVFGVVNYTSFSTPVSYPYVLNLSNSADLIGIGWYNYPRIFAGNSLYSTTSISINTNYLSYALLNSSSSVIGINGSTTTGDAGIYNANGITMFNEKGGNGAAFNGYIYEIIIYANNNSSNRTGIESNINSYYTI